MILKIIFVVFNVNRIIFLLRTSFNDDFIVTFQCFMYILTGMPLVKICTFHKFIYISKQTIQNQNIFIVHINTIHVHFYKVAVFLFLNEKSNYLIIISLLCSIFTCHIIVFNIHKDIDSQFYQLFKFKLTQIHHIFSDSKV